MSPTAKPATVEEYLGGLEPAPRRGVEQMREVIRAAAPHATEVIAYDMPAMRDDGRFLVSYAAYAKHWSLFPADQVVLGELGDEARQYARGKGTFRFPMKAGLPLDLVRRIVEIRVRELAEEKTRRA